MSHYFSIEPLGIGTPLVESFSSYFARLAMAHGVSPNQFVNHLRHWWTESTGQHLPRCEYVRLNGYSADVEIVLAAVGAATGRTDLRACTLMALRKVCAANCIGSVRSARSWCPACYRDDLTEGRPIHDRLAWQLQATERCSLHRLTLISSCPECGSHQAFRMRTIDMARCVACSFNLSRPDDKRFYRPKPCFGEPHIEALIAKTASEPAIEFSSDSVGRFIASLQKRRNLGNIEEAIGDLFHTRPIPTRPQLNSLIGLAAYLDVDIVGLLTQPEEAAAQLSLGFRIPTPRRKTRPHIHSKNERGALFAAKLQAVVAGKGPYPSLKQFCHLNDFSFSGARSFYRGLSTQLIRKRQDYLAEKLSKVRLLALRALQRELRRNRWSSQDSLVAQIAWETEAPIHVVRKVLKELLGSA